FHFFIFSFCSLFCSLRVGYFACMWHSVSALRHPVTEQAAGTGSILLNRGCGGRFCGVWALKFK
ncbi:MAG: hypothetical protein MJZ45_05760, partial [Bacteroidales bacterium]|nr:hypothetical protein [Bacteroidales bacterium]